MSYNKCIFDVGANNGIDGLAMAINNHDCYVHAFEPNPLIFNFLNITIFLNYKFIMWMKNSFWIRPVSFKKVHT